MTNQRPRRVGGALMVALTALALAPVAAVLISLIVLREQYGLRWVFGPVLVAWATWLLLLPAARWLWGVLL